MFARFALLVIHWPSVPNLYIRLNVVHRPWEPNLYIRLGNDKRSAWECRLRRSASSSDSHGVLMGDSIRRSVGPRVGTARRRRASKTAFPRRTVGTRSPVVSIIRRD
jgi:hypothetical protein